LPLSGVLVTVTDSHGNTQEFTTGDDGSYSFEVAAGPVTVEYDAPTGYIDTVGAFDVGAGQVTDANPAQIAPEGVEVLVGDLTGRVADAQNPTLGVPNITVSLRAGVNIRSGAAVAQAVTDTSGYYTFTGVNVGTYTLEASGADFSATYQDVYVLEGGNTAPDTLVSAELQEGQLRVVLTWGDSPSDLDSWLYLPSGSYVSYGSRGSLTVDPFAALDVDDTSSYGPETITIAQTIAGTYQYYVHNYSGSPDITTSMAMVRVFGEAGLVHEVSVPVVGTGRYWHVFDFDGATLEITPVNTIRESGPCTAGTTDCGSGCVDTNYDAANCGGCGDACDVSEVCIQGTCTLG
jgi:hypothetical protein